MYKIILKPKAEKYLRKLDVKSLQYVLKSLKEIERLFPDVVNVKTISSNPRIFRKRVGRHRILFTVDNLLKIINIWIIDLEKDTKKDYNRWIPYIISQI